MPDSAWIGFAAGLIGWSLWMWFSGRKMRKETERKIQDMDRQTRIVYLTHLLELGDTLDEAVLLRARGELDRLLVEDGLMERT
jgi:hypothetical protein